MFAHALRRVRYVDDGQTDTNMTRKRPHPLWRAAREHVETSLFDHRSGLTPGQLVELEREQAVVRYQSNLRGYIAGMAVALGLDDDEMEVDLPDIIGNETRSFVEDQDGRFAKSVQRRVCRIFALAIAKYYGRTVVFIIQRHRERPPRGFLSMQVLCP